MRSYVAAVTVTVLVAACGGSEGGEAAHTLSCDFASGGTCQTIMGKMTEQDVGDLQSECMALGGTNFDGACSTSNMVPGHCHIELSSGATADAYYYSSKWTLAEAQADCTTNPPTGTWVPATAGGTFVATGSMTTARAWHTATPLANGKVLVAGGGVASAELFDPATGTFSATGGMGTGRGGHTATLLPNGKVLVAGGSLHGAPVPGPAELYDASTGAFMLTDTMLTDRYGHTASLLSNGKVLVTGGFDGAAETRSAELFAP
jgi:hypothetical protein